MLHVSCAIIEKEDKVLCAKRGPERALPGKWEFPGGKVEPLEAPAHCVVREIQEELSLIISVKNTLNPVIHHYSYDTIKLYPFVCQIEGGEMILHEHEEVKWLNKSELKELDWADGDFEILEHYLQLTPQPANS